VPDLGVSEPVAMLRDALFERSSSFDGLRMRMGV
jgi:hypothetical protein